MVAEPGLGVAGSENAVSQRVFERNLRGGAAQLGQILEGRDDLSHRLPQVLVIGPQAWPIDARRVGQGRGGQAGDDGHLAPQARRSRRQAALGEAHLAHQILDRHGLFPAVASVFIGSGQAGQNQSPLSGGQVAAIQLGRDHHRQAAVPQGPLDEARVRSRGRQVAPEAEQDVGPAVGQRAEGRDRAHSGRSRDADGEMLFQGLQERRRHVLAHARRSQSLDVAVAARRQHTGPGPADVPLQQQQVDDLPDGLHRVPMVGNPQAPAGDDVLGRQVHVGGCEQFPFLQAAGRNERLPGRIEDPLPVRLEPAGVLLDETGVQDSAPPRFGFQHGLDHASDQGHVAVDDRLQVQVRQLGVAAQVRAGFLRVGKPQQAGFGQGIDGDDLGSLADGRLQGPKHARVVRSGIMAKQEDGIRPGQVLQRDAALAKAQAQRQRFPGRLVTQVGAVGQVVGPERAGQQLIQEGGFVRGSAGCIEDRFIGMRQRVQFPGHNLECLVPRDGPIVSRALFQQQGGGQASLLFEPVIRGQQEVGHGPLFEERRREQPRGGFGTDILGAVFTEFEPRPLVVRIRPGAARTAETADLIQVPDQLPRPVQSRLLVQVGQRGEHRVHAAGEALGLIDLQADDRRRVVLQIRRLERSHRPDDLPAQRFHPGQQGDPVATSAGFVRLQDVPGQTSRLHQAHQRRQPGIRDVVVQNRIPDPLVKADHPRQVRRKQLFPLRARNEAPALASHQSGVQQRVPDHPAQGDAVRGNQRHRLAQGNRAFDEQQAPQSLLERRVSRVGRLQHGQVGPVVVDQATERRIEQQGPCQGQMQDLLGNGEHPARHRVDGQQQELAGVG